jgi:iron complex outermembrane receptor protein
MKLKRLLRITILSMLLLAASQTMMAQNRTITGTVTDEKNNPIAGASITVKGNTTGTAADAQGNFTLSIPASAKTLVISSVGYPGQEVSIGSKTSYEITLISPYTGFK